MAGNPNGMSIEEKEAMQDRLLDMSEEWERRKGKWACNGCNRPISPSDIEYSRETCDCGGDLIESNLPDEPEGDYVGIGRNGPTPR